MFPLMVLLSIGSILANVSGMKSAAEEERTEEEKIKLIAEIKGVSYETAERMYRAYQEWHERDNDITSVVDISHRPENSPIADHGEKPPPDEKEGST